MKTRRKRYPKKCWHPDKECKYKLKWDKRCKNTQRLRSWVPCPYDVTENPLYINGGVAGKQKALDEAKEKMIQKRKRTSKLILKKLKLIFLLREELKDEKAAREEVLASR